MKKYIKAKGNGINYLKVETYYDLGGINYFTYTQDERGYYLSVTPVMRENRGSYATESYTAFTGIKAFLLGVKRKAPKKEAEAEKLAEGRIPELVSYVCHKQGITLEDGFTLVD